MAIPQPAPSLLNLTFGTYKHNWQRLVNMYKVGHFMMNDNIQDLQGSIWDTAYGILDKIACDQLPFLFFQTRPLNEYKRHLPCDHSFPVFYSFEIRKANCYDYR